MNNKIYLPSIRSEVDSFFVMSLLEKASRLEKKGKEIFHFELGEPLESTPEPIKSKINKLISSNVSGYTASNGIFKLRESISNFYEKNYKVKVCPEQIFITTGSSGAFLLSFMSIFDPGKKVGIFNPVYPAYRNILKSLNIEVVEIYPPSNAADTIEISMIEKFGYLDGLVISNPNNPNGQVFSENELMYLYEFCEKNKIVIISDEIYHRIEYSKNSKTMLNFGPRTIVINSFSKYFCMPGWRLGWAIVPADIKDNFLKLSQNLFISSGNVAQYSALNVFNHTQYFDNIVKEYEKNLNLVDRELSKIKKISFKKPKGAFYFYINISQLGVNSIELCEKILSATGVVLTPGIDFDKKNGYKYLRLAFSGKTSLVERGIEKLKDWLLNTH